MNKSKLIWGGIVVVALAFAGFLWYQSYSGKSAGPAVKNDSAAMDEEASLRDIIDSELLTEEGDALADQDFNSLCENGEWVKVSDESGATTVFSGKLRRVYPDDESASQFKSYLFFLESAEKLGLTAQKPVTLDYFEDREVEIQGVKSADKKEVAVVQVRCAGQETNKDVIGERKKLMDFLQANINSIASQKARHQKWTVDIVDFVDEKNVYVEYYDTVEDDENSDIEEDTAKRVLLETAAKTSGYDAKILAYWEMGEDDYVLKTGADKFEEVEDIISYQYDPETKTWERID